MVPDAIPGFDDDQVEPERQSWHRRAIRQDAPIEQPVGGGPHANALAMINGLLGQAEVPAGPPADLHDHQRRGRTWVDRDEVELVATHVDVPGKDRPAGVRESCSDERLGGIAGLLCRRSGRIVWSVRHDRILAAGPYRPRIGDHRGDVQMGAVSSSDARSRASSIASSAMTGVSSRASSSCASDDAAGSARRSSSS
jgi:hypothetical protein